MDCSGRVPKVDSDRNSHLLKTKGSVPSCPHRFVDAAAGTPILITTIRV